MSLLIFCLFGTIIGNIFGIEQQLFSPSINNNDSIKAIATIDRGETSNKLKISLKVERSPENSKRAYNITITRWQLSHDDGRYGDLYTGTTTQLILKAREAQVNTSFDHESESVDCDGVRMLIKLNQNGRAIYFKMTLPTFRINLVIIHKLHVNFANLSIYSGPVYFSTFLIL